MARIVDVPYISRVEGKSALEIKMRGDTIEDLKFRIYEAPRFFEAFLIGRRYYEVHEIVSRICGVCPVTHQITALKSIEKILGLEVPEHIRYLRELTAIGGILSSHALHLFAMALPDYTGHPDIIAMAKDHPDIVKAGFKIKEVGDSLVEIIGGRSVHPVSTIVGGFTSIPTRERLKRFKDTLIEARNLALKHSSFISSLDYPRFERRSEHIAFYDRGDYPVNYGIVKSTEGLELTEDDYRRQVYEVEVGYSTAKHSYVKGRSSFMVGPLPRVNINYRNLSDDAKDILSSSMFRFPCFNPFASNIARLAEIVTFIDKALMIIDEKPLEGRPHVEAKLRAGEASAITEAPRGLNFHSYRLNDSGVVTYTSIAPPTCQNAANIEADLLEYLKDYTDRSDYEIARRSEMLVRAYDPCISCATHLLEVKISRV
ncbi:MAG: Ni/Fe hydrogenase subunit alpha [Candidatus Bathyarchaeota archaeon]|nr:Ni/Fe hydrogenase subunit alpha [Candidatus Bathyarchaeota archaeon]